jgi:hypothetical protein
MNHTIRKISTILSKNTPEIVTCIGIVGTIMSIKLGMNPDRLFIRYQITGDEKYLLDYYRMTKSNNWLRLHGYPMRRKVQIRKIRKTHQNRKRA